MNFIKKTPKTKTYIDGNEVSHYYTKATHQRIHDLNRKKNDDVNCGQRVVFRYDRHYNNKTRYVSVSEASRENDTERSSIRRCADGEYKSAGGFLWKWEEDA